MNEKRKAGRPKGSKKATADKKKDFERFLATQLKSVRKIIREALTKPVMVDDLRFKAAQLVLDRLFGKPNQATTSKAETTVTWISFTEAKAKRERLQSEIEKIQGTPEELDP